MIEINGTPGNDNLLGTGEADVIFALTGDDIISGFSGGDSLFGFEGNDTLFGNEGNDTLFGNQNLDLLIGDSGDDWLFGGKEGDIIEDGEGEDQVFGNLGDDLLRGGAGNDNRYGGQANDTVIGGTGNDQVFGDRGNDILWGVDIDAVNPGIDEIDILTGGSEQDIFVLGDESRLYYIGSGNNDFALITDFNVVEDQINVGNNQVTYTETVLNELGLGVAISSQNGDLIAFVQNATVNQFITGSNVVEPPQTDEAIPRQIEEPQFPEAVLSPEPVVTPTPTADPVIVPTPTPDPIVTPTPDTITPTPTPDPITPTPTPDPITPTPTPDAITPTPTPDPVTPTPTPDAITPTPTPDAITPTPTPDPVTPTLTSDPITPTLTPDPVTPTLTPDPVTPTLTPDPVTPTPTSDPVTPTLTPDPITPTPNPITPTPTSDPVTPTPTPDPITPTPTPDPVTPTPTPDPVTPTPTPDPVTPTPTPDPEPQPNTPPVAYNDNNYNTGFDSPLKVHASVGVLNNDTDGDGDDLTARLVDLPNQSTIGDVILDSDGSFSYTPNPGFSGTDSFTYVANDGKADSNTATVTINVEPPQPVEQTRTLNGYSHRAENDGEVFRTFLLTNVRDNDQIIDDQDDSDTIGFFPEAIENFIVYEVDEYGYSALLIPEGINGGDIAGRINFDGETEATFYSDVEDGFYSEAEDGILSFNEEGNPFFTDEEGNPLFTEVDKEPKFYLSPDVDLRAKFIKRDDIITEFTELKQIDYQGNSIELKLTDDQGNSILKLDDSFPEEIVVYQFFESESETVLEELVFSPGYHNYELPNKPISLDLAINSLEYIIENNLLFYAVKKSELTLDYLDDQNQEANHLEEELINSLYAGREQTQSVISEKPEPLLPIEKTYSQREIDDTTILTTFLLTNNEDNYQTIDDQDNSDTTSLFPEAVQDFITYNNNNGIQLANVGDRINFNGETELIEEGTTLSFNNEGEPVFTGVEVQTEITPVVDLRIKLIERDDIIAELEPTDEEGNPIVELDDSFEGSIILYEFFDTETETVLEELFLFTNEFSEQSEVDDAVNSLESIIEEDLLSFTLEKPDAIQVILGEVTPSEARSNGEGFVNPEIIN
ncbi:MAG: Ig-like domain-containing protein [Lyngbya sp.]|nr:Ig-like domain-containing protein [Lyngbya sp.]